MTQACVTAPFGRRSAPVRSIERSGPYTFLRALDAAGPKPRAGQFYMLQTARGWGGGDDGRPYLPRALSFARVEQVNGGLELTYFLESVGPGTARLAACATGEELLIAGPFGNGFDLDRTRPPVLVAGGVGLAPIVALDDKIRKTDGARSTVLVGMRDGERAAAITKFGVECGIATEDGSAGHAGYVTALLERELEDGHDSTVYACGPPAMLEAVRALCSEREVPCQLALESGMACGYGACYGCVVPTVDGYARLCVDGPVLPGDKLETAIVKGAGH
ncbi:MAG: dihydroorotate dehydrogenase electron transfer subunit [Actinobacteria bacterium]|nr:dihydroorotate dehydrogenase electron transfer subunit [Actinomycetota bacterium]